jgi:hypothetical protein
MCGIAGFVERPGGPGSRREADFALVHGMCEVIRHRGPDDEGIHVEGGVGLGMRRLSIIDLSTGHQPIHNEHEDVWLVFNGEIYNYRELRTELEHAGHRFYTASDTETIVHAYEEWGEDCFRKLRGMFGIALWDRRSRTLLLARDSAGSSSPPSFSVSCGNTCQGGATTRCDSGSCWSSSCGSDTTWTRQLPRWRAPPVAPPDDPGPRLGRWQGGTRPALLR